MASYRDWMNIENPNSLNENQLKQAIRSMGNAANKRLKRMENRGIYYGDDTGADTSSGVKRFTVKGKSLSELKNEFKRVRNFLNAKQSSLTGMKKVYREFNKRIGKKSRRLTRAERKEYEKMKKQKAATGRVSDYKLTQWEELQEWRKTWKMYNRLVEEGYYSPTEYDSSQTIDKVLAHVKMSEEKNLSDVETWRRILEQYTEEYEEEQRSNESENDISTSSLIFGSSD